MANVTISNLPSATSVTTADVLPIVQGGVTKKAILPVNADLTGGNVRIGINTAAPTGNILRLAQDTGNTSDQGINNPVFIQRTVGVDEGASNPKALRVKTIVNVQTSQTEWAGSFELDNYSNTPSAGNAAITGYATKFGTASVFASNFNAADANTYAASTDVTSLIGCEIDARAIGVDHPTSNGNLGRRFGLIVIPKNYSGTNAEVGVGVWVHPESAANGATFRYGVAVTDDEAGTNLNPINTAAILVHSAAPIGISLTKDAAIGIYASGTYSGSALKVNQDQKIAFKGDTSIAMKWDSGTSRLWMMGSTNERVGFVISATPAMYMNAVQVVAERVTGFTTSSGTANKNASGINVDTITATDANIRAIGAWLKAVNDAITTHGLIGS